MAVYLFSNGPLIKEVLHSNGENFKEFANFLESYRENHRKFDYTLLKDKFFLLDCEEETVIITFNTFDEVKEYCSKRNFFYIGVHFNKY